jgi:hypothetical protein
MTVFFNQAGHRDVAERRINNHSIGKIKYRFTYFGGQIPRFRPRAFRDNGKDVSVVLGMENI